MNLSRAKARAPGIVLVGCVVLLLTACNDKLRVRLASENETLPSPRFLIHEQNSPEGPHYDTIVVVDERDERLWRIRAEPFGLRLQEAEVTYGVTPEGFLTLDEPVPLEEGKTYFVFVEGRDTGTLQIKVEAGGQVAAKR